MSKARKSSNVQNVLFGLKRLKAVTKWHVNVAKISALNVEQSKKIAIAIWKKTTKGLEDKGNDLFNYF